MFKRGQKVVAVLSGAGVETASLQTIARVSKRRVQCEDLDAWYDQKTGRAAEAGAFGFSSRLIALEA